MRPDMNLCAPAHDAGHNETCSRCADPALGRLLRPTDSVTMPGGGRITATWTAPDALTIELIGDLDVYDQQAAIDLLASYLVQGARFVHVDANRLDFVDIRMLTTINRVRRFLRRSGGDLEISGMRASLLRIWLVLTGELESVGGAAGKRTSSAPARRRPRRQPRAVAA